MKTCSCCGIEKDRSLFSKHRQKPDGLYSYCKECKKVKDSASFKRHAEKRLAKQREWNKANPDKVRAYKRKWNTQNEDYIQSWHEENPDKKKKYSQKYKKENKDVVLADTRLRQCRQINATPRWANKEAMRAKYRLARFFTELSGGFVKYHVDHIVPLRGETVCGLPVENNLQVLPAHLNLAKSNEHQNN
jgi:hypothetical protein